VVPIRRALLALALAAAALLHAPAPARADRLAEIARCLADRGAVFYGASWCPYCRKQLRAFGNSARFLPYVECSDPNTRRTRPECRAAGVRSYPTWVFPNGLVVSGSKPPEELAALSGCE
jgi:thiol-disulfide isomerase/thioredoxin